VSGGPDSLALLHYLWKQNQKNDFYLVAAHVDHMFRGIESFNDAKFVGGFCEDHDIEFRMKRINVPEYIKKTGKSSEVAARECRYQFFAEVMDECQLPYLVLAHHGDDQIETILMRLTRGSSGSARAGIPFLRPFHNGSLFRPFLCLNRDEIEHYCEKNHLSPRHDPSNEKDVYLRNRFRKYVVPFLKKENSHVHEHFQRFSEELQEDEGFLKELTLQKMNTVWKEKKDDKVTIEINTLQAMPKPLQRRAVQLILNYLYKNRPESLSAIHIEQIFTLIKGNHPSGSLDFPAGLKVIRSYQLCYFRFDQNQVEEFYFELDGPGECILPNGDAIILEETKTAAEENGLYTMRLSKEDLTFPIIIRTRKPGDRMSLKGMKGTKKIKSIFIEKKIPIEKRKDWPLVTDGNHSILWLPGLKKSRVENDGDNGKNDILLTYRRL
jgi:tRNA(Ile)-lysidine synthase